MTIKHVQFRNIVSLNLDGSQDPRMGLGADMVESMEWVARGTVLAITLRRAGGVVNVPVSNIACWTDFTEAEVNDRRIRAEITSDAAKLQATATPANVGLAQAQQLKRRTINDM